MIMLYTSEEATGSVFIRTDQLDGETDWKLRKSITATQREYTEKKNFSTHNHSYCKVEPPSALIYEFKGKYYHHENRDDRENDERLSLENTIWCNTVLASKGYIYGLAIYTAKDTRA